MAEKSNTLKHEKEQIPTDESLKREEVLAALHRLRQIGEKLPPVDAAIIIREGRILAEQGSR
jgi:hypothetical protein